MKGYPKHIATRQDFLNLLAMPEHKKQALSDLQAIADYDDDKSLFSTASIDEKTSESDLKEIDNPLPVWQAKGFKSRQEIVDIIKEAQNV